MVEILKVNKTKGMDNRASHDERTERATAVRKVYATKTGSDFQVAAPNTLETDQLSKRQSRSQCP